MGHSGGHSMGHSGGTHMGGVSHHSGHTSHGHTSHYGGYGDMAAATEESELVAIRGLDTLVLAVTDIHMAIAALD